MAEWVFERRTRDGGASGEAVPNAVEAGGWSCTEELLVREAIQNSVDAQATPTSVVKVSFRVHQLVGDAKLEFLDLAEIDRIAERNTDNQLKLFPGNALELANDATAPLNLLFVEDWNTKGLGGALSGRNVGNFFRLLLVIGDGRKGDANDGSGGSYGFGKGVYSYNSNIRTIFAFSVFEPTEETAGVWARLYGCAFLPSHVHQDVDWTGRVWFGCPAQDTHDGQSPFPLVNEEACELAKKLGFKARDKGEHGTSILIVGCDTGGLPISTSKLAHAAETWWWPRITDGRLSVELVENGVRQKGLDPLARSDLEPYIKVRNRILSRSLDEAVTVKTFNRVVPHEVGTLGLVAVTPEDDAFEALSNAQDEGEDRQGKSPAHRSIAYIRDPGMVVTYRSWGMSAPSSAVGVFQAHHDIDQHLKLSEPVEHDRWDPHSRRLQALPKGAEVVKAVEQRCKRELRGFLKSLQPPPPPPRAGLEWLGKLLGQILTPRNRTQPPPPSGDRGAVSIQTLVEPSIVAADHGNVRFVASYSIGMKPEHVDGSQVIDVSARLQVLEGDSSSRGATLRVGIHDAKGKELASLGEHPEILLEVEGEDRTTIHVASEPFSPDWAVGLHLEAAPREKEMS